MSAMVAFSIDSMLPAMGVIADELTPDIPNRAQWVIASFFLGLGVGTLLAGPLADAIGRRPTILAGAVLYCVGAVLAWLAPSLELVLAARVLQGLGVAGPRVMTIAVTRDLYQGREMARVISLVMMVFVLVPAVAPLIGSWIMAATGWRGIFLSFIAFAALVVGWYALRQGETLAPQHRRPLRAGVLWAGMVEILCMRRVLLTILAQMLAFAIIVMMISTAQQVFAQSYDREASFPWWFALMSVASAPAGFANARLVVRYGMRRITGVAFAAQGVLAATMTALLLSPAEVPFALYIFWMWTAFCTAGFTIGNLNALGLEPLGHLAGLGSSVIMALATVGAVFVVAPAGVFFDGTPLVQTVLLAICGLIGWGFTRAIDDLDLEPA